MQNKQDGQEFVGHGSSCQLRESKQQKDSKPVVQVSEMHFTLPAKGWAGVTEQMQSFLMAFCLLVARVPMICNKGRGISSCHSKYY